MVIHDPTLHPFLHFVRNVSYLFWRARPHYGRARGLPPGSLALLPLGQWNDQRYYEKKFSRYGPIFKASDLYRPAACILGIERGREFLAQHRDALIVPAFPFNRFIPDGFLRFTDSARHQTYRPVFQSAFAPALVRDAASWMAQIFHQEFARMANDSAQSANGIYPPPYIERMLLCIFARLFFGIASDSAAFPTFEKMLHIIALRRAWRVSDRAVTQTLAEMVELIENTATQFPDTPSFVSELARAHPQQWRDPFLLYNLIYIFQIGRSDMAGLLFWILKMLSEHPVWLERVRDENSASDLPTRIVLETLRLEQSEFLLRQTTRDIYFENFWIPKGWFVRICIHESHRAPAIFENPETFNPDRFRARRYTNFEYMPFGAFHKACMGEHLTLTVAKIFCQELARNFEWRVVQDGAHEFNGFHWQPSLRFRMKLKQIAL